MNKYLKFEYWNTCDLGNIYYQGGQHFIFYLDADVGEPIHEEVEEGQENGDGDFIPTYRRQMKRYRIRTGLIPDYLIDAIQRMKLHDNIELTFKSGEIEQIYNVDCEAEWQFEKYAWQGTVTLTFDMDESITVGACCDNLVVQTGGGEPEPDDLYWVAETGSDISGDGTYANPWATLGYATTQATTPGDVIHVKAGTITETVQSSLAVGVSIIGAGNSSIIKSNYAWSLAWPSTLIATVSLRSTSEGTDGNQSISYLRFDGDNLTATAAICVSARSNVSIHHCEFENFLTYGVSFTGTVDFSYGEATIYASNNSFHDNIMTNCATNRTGGVGSLLIGSDQDMLIYNNTFNEGTREWAYSIQKVCFGFHKGLKVYNNSITGVELWYCRGGIEFYNNNITKAIDFGGIDATWGNEDINDAGGYGYGAKIYDNTIGNATYETDWRSGINLEQTILGGVQIYRNKIYRRPVPIMFSPSSNNCNVEEIDIFYNIFYDIGRTGSPLAYGVWLKSSATGVTCSDINIWNNVIVSEASPYQYAGVCFGGVTGSNISIRNNIIQGSAAYCIMFDDGAILDVVSIENNLFYNNAHADVVYTNAGAAITNRTEQNNITADNPDFITPQSNYHLQASSPCINAGIDVGLTTDYDGQAVSDPPEIGAYEY